MGNELARELAAFPFAKLNPLDFRLEIAALSEGEMEKRPVKIWIETDEVTKVLKIAGFARIIRSYPHLGFVYLETYARELVSLVASDLVRSVWNDLPLKAEGCLVVAEADPSARTLARRADGGTC